RMYAYLQAVGTVVPVQEIEVKSEMAGRIYFTKKWKEGDEVKKGDVIASIDDRELRLNINEAELNLNLAKNSIPSARAELDQAKKDEEFNRAMLERGAISKAEYEQAVLSRIRQENSYEQTEKNVDARRMSLQKLQQELETVEVTVAFDGVLLPPNQSVSSQPGNEADLTQMEGTIIGSQAVVCRLANIDKVYVALDIPAKDLLMVQVGQDVELDVYSRIGRQYKGTVADISTTLNSSTRTYTVNVLVDNPEHEMRPGMFAKARIITEEKKDALSIPRELVLLRNNRNVVFVAVEKPADEIEDASGTKRFEREEKKNPVAQEKEEGGRQLAMAGGSD
ncbi:efflux RND transporter periplasmic adaptor subunit, partial [bacterium]|nr:efflux RND transporter periplasmic adaptor subunit [bacterium]